MEMAAQLAAFRTQRFMHSERVMVVFGRPMLFVRRSGYPDNGSDGESRKYVYDI